VRAASERKRIGFRALEAGNAAQLPFIPEAPSRIGNTDAPLKRRASAYIPLACAGGRPVPPERDKRKNTKPVIFFNGAAPSMSDADIRHCEA